MSSQEVIVLSKRTEEGDGGGILIPLSLDADELGWDRHG